MRQYIKSISGIVVLSLFFVTGLVATPSPASAEVTPIPVGCPGTNIQGPPTAQESAVCAGIPVGCPGSTQTGTPPANFDKSTCPYGVDHPDGESSIAADCANSQAEADANQKKGQGASVVCDIEGNGIITKIINPAIKVFTILVGVVAVIMLIVAGIIYSSAQDDPKRIALAKKIIIDVVIGVAAYVFLFAFLNYILPQGAGS